MGNTLPYYPMYVFDFDEDPCVLGMNLTEVGLYLLALNEAWKRGSIPDDPTALAGLIRRKPADVKKAWLKVRPCWIESSAPGKLVNRRQEMERAEVIEKQKRAQNAGLSSASARKKRNGVERTLVPYASDSGSEFDSGLKLSNYEDSSTRARIDADAGLRLWTNHRGFKKPARSLRPRILERIRELDLTEVEYEAALDGFQQSDWAKKNGYPIFGFLKDPASWIPADYAPQEEVPDAPVDLPTPTLEPIRPAAPVFDTEALWNANVPSSMYVRDRYYPAVEVATCESDTDYRGRAVAAMGIAEKMIQARGGEVGWLTLPWFVGKKQGKPPGWYRLLTEMRWMAEVPNGKKAATEESVYDKVRREIANGTF